MWRRLFWVLLFICFISSFFIWNITTHKFINVEYQEKVKIFKRIQYKYALYRLRLYTLQDAFEHLNQSYSLSSNSKLNDSSLLEILETGVLKLHEIKEIHRSLNYIKRQIPLNSPLHIPLEISSNFGARLDPFVHQQAFHTGVDFIAAEGYPVYATATGKVVSPNKNSAYGTNIFLSHDYGFYTLYGHLQRIDPSIRVGKWVKSGQVIGYVGHTGRASGSHLHYEITLNNELINPLDFLE